MADTILRTGSSEPQKADARPEELLSVDLLRFFAAMAIVLHHYKGVIFPGLGMGWLAQHTDFLTDFVDLFFAISGFVISYVYAARMDSIRDYLDFLRKRVARLAPLHWATLLFYVAIGAAVAAFNIRSEGAYDWGCLVPQVLMIHSWGLCRSLSFNGVSWSISVELALYLVFPLLLSVLHWSRWSILSAAILIFAALFAVSPDGAWAGWTYDFGVARALPSFLIGMTLFNFRRELRLPKPGMLMAAALLAMVGFGIALDYKALLLPLGWLAVAAAIAQDQNGQPGKVVRSFGQLGQLTYSIYMLHPVVNKIVIEFAAVRVLHLSGIPLAAVGLAAIFLTLGVSYVSYVWFELPLRRLIAGKPRPPLKRVAARSAP